MWEVGVRFMREAWVLLSSVAGDVTCWVADADSVAAELSFGAVGGKELRAALLRAVGLRLR